MADSAVQSLRDRIDEQIAAAHPRIQDHVLSQFVDAEILRRAQILASGINTLRELEADQKKVDRPDNTLYTADGTVAQSQYTKGRLDEIKKVKDKVTKLQTALDKAIESNAADDYKKLEEAIKKAKTKGGSAPADDAAED